ncbi:hypothetical protein YZ82_01550 [Campylobacter hyointestinalis]|uniref:Uncharacterized protein n=1 Tax=Campylobacter hyointestinalis TaxID=198 RepID=A0A562XKG5_CAMHY|nr:hypothetical protein [Campylobacter hyointestinalis]TWO22628.1 hypothetical protein YZ82_01550 [Campylobacter hyointestinalis]
MANKIFDSLVFSPTKSKQEIVTALVAAITKREKADPTNNWIARVSHIYNVGENARASYFVIGDSLKEQKQLSSNLVETPVAQASNAEIDEARVSQIVDEKLQEQSSTINDERILQIVENEIANNQTLSELVRSEVAKNKTSLDISDIIAFS